MRYVPNTDADRRAMLEAIGLSSLDDLFRDIPEAVRSRFEPLGIPGRSEQEVAGEFAALASANAASTKASLLGGGVYDHYSPSIIGHMLSRTEFYTAYTPYQPEISQGTLSVMFEFQTLIAELTGMEIANASMYDGATSLAEAMLMASRIRRNTKIAVSKSLLPAYRRVLDTYAWAADLELCEVPFDTAGRLDLSGMPEDPAVLIVQSPNAFGVIESLAGVKDQLGDTLLIVSTYPMSLGLIEPPGALGADIVTGEGQSLGLPMGFGGPLLGLFATKKAYLRQMPGRVAGRTVDSEGATGYAMAAQTREQHIRRERATSNICTNSALCALAATVYLATVGADGLRHVARLNRDKAHYLAEKLCELDGYDLAFDAPFFNEFVVRVPGDPEGLRQMLDQAGFLVGGSEDLASLGVPNALRFAVTESRTREELDRVVRLLGGVR